MLLRDNNSMLIEDALKNATDEQIKSEWARRTQAMRRTRSGGRKSRDAPVEVEVPMASLKEQLQASIDLIKKQGSEPIQHVVAEVPMCRFSWWEDGEQYECLMDKGHKSVKHGQAGMVQRVEQ